MTLETKTVAASDGGQTPVSGLIEIKRVVGHSGLEPRIYAVPHICWYGSVVVKRPAVIRVLG